MVASSILLWYFDFMTVQYFMAFCPTDMVTYRSKIHRPSHPSSDPFSTQCDETQWCNVYAYGDIGHYSRRSSYTSIGLQKKQDLKNAVSFQHGNQQTSETITTEALAKTLVKAHCLKQSQKQLLKTCWNSCWNTWTLADQVISGMGMSLELPKQIWRLHQLCDNRTMSRHCSKHQSGATVLADLAQNAKEIWQILTAEKWKVRLESIRDEHSRWTMNSYERIW
jgi:hypothetical protein